MPMYLKLLKYIQQELDNGLMGFLFGPIAVSARTPSPPPHIANTTHSLYEPYEPGIIAMTSLLRHTAADL